MAFTLAAWAVPSGLALWLDVERFSRPYCNGEQGYVRDAGFQALMFVIRFGWWLGLIIALILVLQAALLKGRTSPAK